MELYDWNRNKSKENSTGILNWGATNDSKVEPPQEYAKSVETLFNDGENEYNLEKYKEQVVKMLGIAWRKPSPVEIPPSVPPITIESKSKKKNKRDKKPEAPQSPPIPQIEEKPKLPRQRESPKPKQYEAPKPQEVAPQIVPSKEVKPDEKQSGDKRIFWFHPWTLKL